MPQNRVRHLAIGALALSLALTGCTSGAKPDLEAELQRLTEKSDALQQQVEALSSRNQELEEQVKSLEQKAQQAGTAKGVPVNLVEPRYAEMAGWEKWAYRKELKVDLNGDGNPEKVIVTNNAAVDPATREVAWDDGHPWQVYVEEANGGRTLLYARRIQLGGLEVMAGEQPAGLIIQQEGGAGVSLYHVTYQGPGRSSAVELLDVLILDRASFQPPNIAVE